jgi:hypothetical protein
MFFDEFGSSFISFTTRLENLYDLYIGKVDLLFDLILNKLMPACYPSQLEINAQLPPNSIIKVNQ